MSREIAERYTATEKEAREIVEKKRWACEDDGGWELDNTVPEETQPAYLPEDYPIPSLEDMLSAAKREAQQTTIGNERQTTNRQQAPLLPGAGRMDDTDKIGIAQTNYERIEAGAFAPNIDILAKIARLYGCKIAVVQLTESPDF